MSLGWACESPQDFDAVSKTVYVWEGAQLYPHALLLLWKPELVTIS